MNNKSLMHFMLCATAFTLFVLLLLPSKELAHKSELPMLGQSSPRSIVAQLSFDVPKNHQELEEEMKRARDRVLPVFEYNDDDTKRITDRFELLMSQIKTYNELQKEISSETANEEKVAAAGDLYQSIIRQISANALRQLILNDFSIDTLKSIFHSMLARGISNTLIAERSRDVSIFEETHNISSVPHILYSRNEVLLIKNGKDTIVETSFIRPKEFLIDAVLDRYKTIIGIPSAYYEILYVFAAPNVFYLDRETEKRRAEAADQVNPSKGMIPRGTAIVAQGAIITKEILEKLEAMQSALKKDSARFLYSAPYGQYILLLMVIAILCFNLWYFRQNKNIRPLQMWAIVIIAITQIILFRLAHDFFLDIVQSEYLNSAWFYPFAFAPVLTSVLFPLRAAMALAIWSSVLFGIFAGYDLPLAISSYLISYVMCLIVNRIRYRVKFLQALFAGFFVFSLALAGVLLLRNSMSLAGYSQNLLLGTINLLICVTFISVFCNVFERVFQITTNLKLAELSDFNHPLLRRLSEYAPGSFHHSILVGNLGEIACKRIGADALLLRVMALYHDIGKIMRPEFFTENQRFDFNPHDSLSPYDSIKILRSHIERGIEFAQEHNLPDQVIAGIREHHGNSVAFFFYNKVKEMYPDKEIIFSDFCYKGTIPQSKETAILMLADTIEATSRSMQKAKPEELSKMIQKTIEDKMFDNQLDDSGLTIHDLKELGEGFLQGLEGSIHSRIQYPSIFTKKR
ncbi:MAG: HDIG domain-containing protein [Fibromonadaceae bacterium]|jgi:putative nucleotidyltransferase with HDIG domain|nr:HDIG domain-containing protein [Fibromonadaceae bacterium]